ncbi:type II secretion system protein [Clostridium perfringens]|uniref:type II secretion system protein n=1 Tax=Clostridium perfringens TaxID=1502 RepID=UPI0023402D53|nr:type II secretion system protein [Clostridium perfringens]MDC4245123.1 type II secretion system GspH family protein [Clostridium perfringens]
MLLLKASAICGKGNEGKRNKKGGFTLIELTVVLAIMAIILTVIAPNFSSVKDSAKAKVENKIVLLLKDLWKCYWQKMLFQVVLQI